MSAIAVTIRPAGKADFPAMKAVLSDTFKRTWLPEIAPMAAAHYVETDIGGAFVDKHGEDMLVALVDETIAGLIYWRDDFIEAVHVAEAFQGRGVGKTLITFAETAIRDAGHPCVKLETDTFNERSRAVYRALGYAERDYYPDDEWNSGFTTVLFEKIFGAGRA